MYTVKDGDRELEARLVLMVAAPGENNDWAAYELEFDPPGEIVRRLGLMRNSAYGPGTMTEHYDDLVRWVAHHGSKMGAAVGERMFPHWANRLAWRR